MGTRSLNIRHLLFGMIILLSGISFLFIIWKVFDIRDDLNNASLISSANLLSDNIMRATILLGSEQSLTLFMSRQPEMVTQQNLDMLDQSRKLADGYINNALSRAREITDSNIQHALHASLNLLNEKSRMLKTARLNADRFFDETLEKGTFSTDIFPGYKSWDKTIGDYIEILLTVRRDAFSPNHGIDKVIRDNRELKEILIQLFKYASWERSLIEDAIAQKRPFKEDELIKLQLNRGSYQYHLDRLFSSLVSNQYYVNDLDNDLLKKEDLDGYDQLRQKILEANKKKQPYPVDATQWFEKASQNINALITVVDHIGENTNESIAYINKQQWQNVNILTIFSIIIFVIISLTALVIRRRIFTPLGRLLAASNHIAAGNFDQPIDVHGSDEFGVLGKSFEQMRLSLLYDSHARKQAVEALKDNQRRTRGIVDAAADSIISVNEEGLIMSFNPASEKIFGYSAREVIGKEIKILMPPDVRENHDHYLKRYLLTGVSNVVNSGARELSAIRKNGELFSLELAITEINFGIERMFILISRDITQRKEIEQALKKARDEAIEANQVKSEFLAGISHELRTPLNSIIGFSEMLLREIDGRLNDEQKNSVHFIEKSGKNLLALINDVLDMSKIEANRMEVSLETVNINKVIEESSESIDILLREKGLILKKELVQDVPAIQADPGRIRQVMLNLLSNAAKFTDTGEVVIRCHKIDAEDKHLPDDVAQGLPSESQWLMVSVQDSGYGIAEVNIPKVFEEFRQIEGGTSRKQGGTGLGVPISKRFIELHGGKMWLTSTEGHGTTFYFILPITTAEQLPSSHDNHDMGDSNEIESIDHGKTRLLVIDDDPATATLCRKFLMESDCHVSNVMLGSEVMDKAASYKPDIILLDIMLPDKDGWQVLEELKANPETENIPVIICSVLDNRQLGLSQGASEFLIKPFNKKMLVSSIEKLMNIRSILVIDNDNQTINLMRTLFRKYAYRIYSATNSMEGLELIRGKKPDLVLLHIHMPNKAGFDVLDSLKQDPELCEIPVIVMTAAELDQEMKAKIKNKAGIVQTSHCSDQYFVNLITKTLRDEVLEEA